MKRWIYLTLAILIGTIYIIFSALYHLESHMWFRTILFVAFIFFVLYMFSEEKDRND